MLALGNLSFYPITETLELMASFSQRKGYKAAAKALQLEEVDRELRASLWSVLHDVYFAHWNATDMYSGGLLSHQGQQIRNLLGFIWCEFFKYPSDTIPQWPQIVATIRKYHFECEWHEVYDLIEFVVKAAPENSRDTFSQLCNFRLQQENSGYRLVGSEVTQITSDSEINEIQTAIESKIPGVQDHLSRALQLLSDRKKPDYRNSAKESISAVEGVCRLFAGGNTLSDALKALKAKIDIHPAFERALTALYGYTSDEGGIRHALLEKSSISFADAKFMLVTCSAFSNYLIGKAAECGLKLKK
jgi:hypothetical protein